jgi:hypothetical protein
MMPTYTLNGKIPREIATAQTANSIKMDKKDHR